MVTSFISICLSRSGFSFFKLKLKGKMNFRFEFQCSVILKIEKPFSCFVSCINFSLETKIKTLFLISYFNLSQKRNGTLGTRTERSNWQCLANPASSFHFKIILYD